MQRTLALIMAGGQSPALSVLTSERSEAAVPFAGKYRIVDFTLSNCVNSGIFSLGVLTQYRPRSLHEHIGVGKPWDLDRRIGGVRVLHPFPTPEGGGWQKGTADAVRYNRDHIEESGADNVLILAGDHVYKMDYRPLLRAHEETEADVTVALHSVSPHDVHRYGIVTVDADGSISAFQEKPRRSLSTLASMGVYVFRRAFLLEALSGTEVDFGRDLLPRLVGRCRTMSYRFEGYWADVGTVQAYYEANIALLGETPALDLSDPNWVIHTRSEERPAAQLGPQARVESSLICDGCRIEGSVVRSVLSPGVYVAPGALVRDSIVLSNASVDVGAVVDRCIVDKEVMIGEHALVGDGDDNAPNESAPDRLNTGLTLIGKRAQVPGGARIGRNVVVRVRSTPAAFGPEKSIPSGRTI